jgi:hypothetical protein
LLPTILLSLIHSHPPAGSDTRKMANEFAQWALTHRTERKMEASKTLNGNGTTKTPQQRLEGWVGYTNKYLLDKATKVKDDKAAEKLYNTCYKSATVKAAPKDSKTLTATLVRNDGKVLEGTFIYLRGGLCKKVK